MNCLIAIDPGRSKCGFVLVDTNEGLVLEGKVAPPNSAREIVFHWKRLVNVERVILGNGTASSKLHGMLREVPLPVTLVEERGTTLRARRRFYELWPLNKFFRWFPQGLLLPPNNLDAVAALILAEDFLEKKLSWPGPPTFTFEL